MLAADVDVVDPAAAAVADVVPGEETAATAEGEDAEDVVVTVLVTGALATDAVVAVVVTVALGHCCCCCTRVVPTLILFALLIFEDKFVVTLDAELFPIELFVEFAARSRPTVFCCCSRCSLVVTPVVNASTMHCV